MGTHFFTNCARPYQELDMKPNFENIYKFILENHESNDAAVHVSGVKSDQWLFVQNSFLDKTETGQSLHQVHIFEDLNTAEKNLDFFRASSQTTALLLPGLEVSPYGGFIESDDNLKRRFNATCKILTSTDTSVHLFTTIDSLLTLGPTKKFFQDNIFKVSISDIINPADLSSKLVDLGYDSAATVEEPGTFSRKGEIFDIYPIGRDPIRIYYFDDMVEEIYSINLENQKTNRDQNFESINIFPSPQIFRKNEYVRNLRNTIQRPALNHSYRLERRKRIFEDLSDGILFENYTHYTPYFLDESGNFLSFLEVEKCVFNIYRFHQCEDNFLSNLETLRVEFEEQTVDTNSDLLLGGPEELISPYSVFQESNHKKIIIDDISIEVDLSENKSIISPRFESFSQVFNKLNLTNQKIKNSQTIAETIQSAKFSNIYVCYVNENSRKEIRHIFETFAPDIHNKIIFLKQFLEEGFSYLNSNEIYLSESDFFTTKIKKTKSKSKRKSIDLFAEQISSLREGDYVVHNTHGIGIYRGLISMDIGGQTNDFVEIEYEEKDKVYVPVYKINLLQKYADKDAPVKVGNLRSNKFDQLKKRAKESAKKLAFNLLKLVAERETAEAYAFNPPDDLYKDFEMKFSFVETPDQETAIADTLDDMQRKKPMDRLVCGDVGFGKTEVAMRAAFKAVLEQKQVAVLVPTTVLALQHYHSFVKRFKDFPVRIEFLSRFKTAKETRLIAEELEAGNIDIIIGTHKLLGKNIKYKDLGLVVVDEEQRFGVTHKEKLKLLKASLDFLTLTATPIPRTLQMAFLGLRDLSIIQTAPPKRQSIKTYIIKKDDHTIREAINKELKRGGQVFFVHNRVRDIEEVHAYIKELCPKAKVAVGHGQMNEKDLEKVMSDFYNGEYNVLLSTTIIESGIDIPNANTMIIDRADMYGLSQLHQLRGRIGRSDKKAYAFFVIPNEKKINEIASKRLQALQTYADMGSGFSIASSDLEIRGAGDLLGGEQSGHIEAVGLEVYMDLLQDAIAEIKGEQREIIKDVEIQTPFGSYIPNHYIEDSALRLKTYKRLSNASNPEEIDLISEELEDQFGVLPEELKNLFLILKSRHFLKKCGVEKAKFTERSLYLYFSKDAVAKDSELNNSIVEFFLKDKSYKFSPDFSVSRNFKKPLGMDQFFSFSKDIAQQIVSD